MSTDIEKFNGGILPAIFAGFTQDEAECGMGAPVSGYLKSFPYFMRAAGSQFKLIDQSTGQEVWSGSEIPKVIAYYTHAVKRLYKGTVEGAGDMETWTEDQKSLVAMSYDWKSNGNFVTNGYGDYLRRGTAESKKVSLRQYMFFIAPSLPSGKNLIAASFGITSAQSIREVRQELDKLMIDVGGGQKQKANLPLPFVFCKLRFVPDVSDKGKDYNRVVLSLNKEAIAAGKFAFESPNAYRTHERGYPLLQQIIDTHKTAVSLAEDNAIDMSGGQSTPAEVVATYTEDGLPPMEAQAPFTESDDDIPF